LRRALPILMCRQIPAMATEVAGDPLELASAWQTDAAE
jgi:hypothetical protein